MSRNPGTNPPILRFLVFWAILFVLIVSSADAQVRFGLFGGTSVSDLSATTTDSLEANFSSGNDLAAGGLIGIPLSSSMALVFEPMYIRKSIDNEFDFFNSPVLSELSFAYVDVPLLLKFSINAGVVSPYLVGGGIFSYLLEAEETFLNDLGKELFGEKVDIKDNVSDVDFGWTAGGGLDVPLGPVGLFAEGRFSRGLNNIFDSDENEAFHEGYQILGGVTFETGPDEDLSAPDQPYYYDIAEHVGDHNCVGHRLMIIIGNHRAEEGKPTDPTIHATANWARELKNVNHKVLFFKRGGETIKLTNPLVPGIEKKTVKITGSRKTKTVTKPGWVPYTYEETKGKKTKTRKGKSKDFGEQELGDCCFLEEVIVLSHGSKASSHIAKRIYEMLPELTGGRPIRKLTLWLCSTSNFLHPDAAGSYRSYYGKFCELMAPRRCPCNCELGLCRNVCVDPENKHPDGYRCPAADEPGRIYMAAWHQQEKGGKNKPHASKLYINPGDASAPLTSPDGSIRVVTVTSGKGGQWTASTSVEQGAKIFGDIEVGAQADYEDDHKGSSSVIGDVDARQKDFSGKAPKPPAYKGPMRCAGGEGCIPVPGDM